MSDSDDTHIVPRSKHGTSEIQPTNWKVINAERKRLRKEWKEKKLLKHLERMQKAQNEVAAFSPEKVDEGTGVTKREVPTVSIAVPGSILDNAQSLELRTLLAGQIARAASISCVDEVIIYDEAGSSNMSQHITNDSVSKEKHSNSCVQMAHILQYLECPQYLRKYFFPLHKDLKFAGLLPPLDSPHHLRESDCSRFREGVILDRPVKDGHGSFVNVGLKKDVQLDKKLDAGLRVTVRLNEQDEKKKKRHIGQAVDPTTPRSEAGLYWGFSVRLAQNLSSVFTESPYSGGYDLTVGTSDKGDSVENLSELPPFRHLLIVFGGVKGLEYALDCDEHLSVDDPKYLFNYYINSFPGQGSRTIRTEEAIFITMAVLRSKIQRVTEL